MTREDVEQLHKLIDKLAAEGVEIDSTTVEVTGTVEPARVLPEGKRVVRTKQGGDKVYLIDEVAKTRQWITKPEILDTLGFIMDDVVEVEEAELFKYNQGEAIYKAPENG